LSPDSDLKKVVKIALVIAVAILMAVLAAPMPRFNAALSTVVEARDGSLLGARIADDGQWRFPPGDEVPEKFRKALLSFEDRYFYFHPGINPVAIFRALKDNMRTGEIVSGGSTITMQVARLSGGNSRRTYGKKILEILQALKMELFRSKKAILKTYAANAPFGGNIVGLDAATWRYAGKSPADITWAEAAALAVLPNSPSLVYPGKNQEILERKRNELLKKLYQRKYIDSLTLVLSMDEPLPGEPKLLPSASPHLTDFYYSSRRGERIRTTIDPAMQERTAAIINNHQKELSGNMIFNAAALIVDVPTGEVLAYAGTARMKDWGSTGEVSTLYALSEAREASLNPCFMPGCRNRGSFFPLHWFPTSDKVSRFYSQKFR
jgi:penicillin-binding protein 1C